MAATPREAADDDSKGSTALRAPFGGLPALSVALLLTGVAGGLLLVAADFSTLLEVRSGGVVRDRIAGGDRHTYGLVPIGVGAVVMAVLVAMRESRPAALALAGLGLVALLICLLADVPDANRSGYLSGFRSADASPGPAFYLEAAGAVLVLLAGSAALALSPQGSGRPVPER
jgi:hypothetical protein